MQSQAAESVRRRRLLQGLALCAAVSGGRIAWGAAADPADVAQALLRQGGGGLVVVMRHALAPGNFDPPGFRVGDCGTQRNLSEEGRAQARRIGAWYRERNLQPAALRSSEWCRCVDTATEAFGTAPTWPALNSVIHERSREPAQTALLRAELARRAKANPPGFELWVTHQSNVIALAGQAPGSGEAVLLRHDPMRHGPVVLATLSIA